MFDTSLSLLLSSSQLPESGPHSLQHSTLAFVLPSAPMAEACVQHPLIHMGPPPAGSPCIPISTCRWGGGSLARRSHCPSAFNPPGASCCFQIPTARDTVQSLPAPPREWPGSLWPPSLCLSHHTFLCSPHPPITQLVLFDPGSHLGLSCSGWVAHSCKSSSYLRLAVQHLLTQEVRGQVHHVPHSQYAAWRLLSGHL